MVEAGAPPPLEPGDRAADFHRPDQDGARFVFFDRCCGRPTVVIAHAGIEATRELAPALRALAQRQSPCVAISTDPVDALATAAATHDLPMPLLHDDGLVLGHLAGRVPASGDPPLAVVLDPQLRLFRRIECPTATLVDAVAAALADLPAVGPPPGITQTTAPVLIVPDVCNPDLRRRLIAAFDADNAPSGMLRMVDGKPTLIPDRDAKLRHDHNLTDPTLSRAVADTLGRRLLPEIGRAFQFAVTRYEVPKVVRYAAPEGAQPGGFFRPHRDNTTPDAAHRRFAMTLNLNDGYEGGALCFPEFGPTLYAPPAGGAIVFSCSLLHEATEIRRGDRYVLLTFFYGEEEAKQREAWRQRQST